MSWGASSWTSALRYVNKLALFYDVLGKLPWVGKAYRDAAKSVRAYGEVVDIATSKSLAFAEARIKALRAGGTGAVGKGITTGGYEPSPATVEPSPWETIGGGGPGGLSPAMSAELAGYQELMDEKKKLDQEYWEDQRQLAADNEVAMEAYHERAQDREEARVQMAKYAAATMMGNWAYFFQYLSTQNEAWFKVFKAFAIAEATINTYIAATKALAQLGPIMGPIAAAAMIAKGLAMVAQISSMSPGAGGGGGGGGAMGTYPASETTGLPTIGGERERGALIIHIEGPFYGDEAFVDMLADKINAAVEERDVRLVSSETR